MEPIPVPKSLLEPLNLKNRLLLGPGPSNVSERVARATAYSSSISHVDPQFPQFFEDIKAGLKYVFQTRNNMTFCITASGHSAMEAAVHNILEEGDVFAAGIIGLWGQRISVMAGRIGAKVIQIKSRSLGEPIDLSEYERVVREHRPKLLYVCHGDSTTGVLQPLDGLGHICAEVGTLLMVDAVASLLSVPLEMDKEKIDVLFTGSQKCLSAHTGLAPVSFSERAVDAIKNRKKSPTSLYLDVMGISGTWACSGPMTYHSTPAVATLVGLREALAIVAEKGLDQVIREHQEVSQYLQDGLEKMGLELFVKNKDHRMPSVIALKIPKGVNDGLLRRRIIQEHGIEVTGGLGPTTGTILRIGIMGVNATRENALKVLEAFRESLSHMKNNL